MSKIIKIIDLLNKIANGEEVPKKIKHQYYDYEWNTIDKDYQKRDGEMLLGNMNIQYHLNDEIILIEDEIDIDNIEKIKDSIIFRVDDFKGEINKSYLCDLLTRQNTYINKILQWAKQIDKRVKKLEGK